MWNPLQVGDPWEGGEKQSCRKRSGEETEQRHPGTFVFLSHNHHGVVVGPKVVGWLLQLLEPRHVKERKNAKKKKKIGNCFINFVHVLSR